ncbi:hypothetical protein E3P92_00166 [Wallemia ichthyophaga]|uniref:Ras-domain-containing protein n=1 Tax=Wallemia ichthyophaga TaxID=245174 RepID=A0A4T0F8X2_WALIC|nr:hypothetical protein E3P98_00307 [Wallemia ichthyophaga]TIB00666.1 hypothetical protein E3P95_01621 [Wallemia ichthyophaga]TIB01004.1 hypothetical protein E3P94_02007 [Wallemia ichthyophaga]TIB16342.1 hypothetical protein E3P90_00454 [Wallemia ichthyophaga]TIB18019.1 hypothetical protein E3P93_00311 [Wallemia ichthyophaga]
MSGKRRPRYVSSSSTDPMQSELEAKVVILGTQREQVSPWLRVGKTSLAERYTSGLFSQNTTAATIGASFLTKKLTIDKTRVRIQIWDTAGEERFKALTPLYYRGAHAAIIVYDITSYNSFLQVKTWLSELTDNLNQSILIAIVGSKSDLESQRKVDFNHAKDKIKEWTAEHSSDFVEVMRNQELPYEKPTRINRSRSTSMSSSIARSYSNNSHTNFHDTSDTPGTPGTLDTPTDNLIDQITLLEVSAKDDSGINDLFLHISRKLVQSKAKLAREQATRHRESIFLSSSTPGDGSVMSDSNLVQSSSSMSRAPSSSNNGWSCC